MVRPMPNKVKMANRDLGEHLMTWRKLLHLTRDQVADRAGISPSTLRRIENGDGGVGISAVLSAARALGIMDEIVKSADPYETEFGRARADRILPKRVR